MQQDISYNGISQAVYDAPRQEEFERRNSQYASLFAQSPPELGPGGQKILADLKKDGISVVPDFWSPEDVVMIREEVKKQLETKRKVKFDGDFADSRVDTSLATPNKDYLLRIVAKEMGESSPLVNKMVDSRMISVAAHYMNIYPLMRGVDIWLNFPNGGPERCSQKWHQDGTDFRMLKVFTYITDVGEKDGPFCFMPGTHFGGAKRDYVPKVSARASTEEVNEKIGRSEWMPCCGKAGDVIFADVTALHRGGRCEDHNRILVQVEFTGHTPWQDGPPKLATEGDDYDLLTRVALGREDGSGQ